MNFNWVLLHCMSMKYRMYTPSTREFLCAYLFRIAKIEWSEPIEFRVHQWLDGMPVGAESTIPAESLGLPDLKRYRFLRIIKIATTSAD